MSNSQNGNDDGRQYVNLRLANDIDINIFIAVGVIIGFIFGTLPHVWRSSSQV